MRENDDTAPGSGDGSLAEGLGETVEPGATVTDPFGDGGFGDTGSDGDADDTFGDGGVLGDGEMSGGELEDSLVDGLPTRDASPAEGVGYLIEQLRDALFGGGDDGGGADPFGEALASALDAGAGDVAEPADLGTDGDLDLTGDGTVDHHDLVEAEHPFDFGV